MAIKATVNTSPGNRVSVDTQKKSTVRTIGIGIVPASQIDNLVELLDVVSVNPANNDTLVYDSATSKYIVKALPIINGGTF